MVFAPTATNNSFFVNIDGEPSDPLMIWDVPPAATFSPRVVSWRGNGAADADQFTPCYFTLAAGEHQLIIRGREPNTQLSGITISPAWPEIQLTVLSGNQCLLQAIGQIGHSYEIQTSSDLRTWTVLRTLTADGRGEMACLDSSPLSYVSRWYRLRDTGL